MSTVWNSRCGFFADTSVIAPPCSLLSSPGIATRCSLDLRSGSANRFTPNLAVHLQRMRELGGCVAHGVGTDVLQPLHEARILRRSCDGARKPLDDRVRRASRRGEPVPGIGAKSREALLCYGGYPLEHRRAVFAGDRKHLDLPAPCIRKHLCEIAEVH